MYNEHLSRYQFESTDILWSYQIGLMSTIQVHGDYVFTTDGYNLTRFDLKVRVILVLEK